MSGSRHLFFLMNHIFVGFALALLYGACAAAAVWYFQGPAIFKQFIDLYFVSYNCVISGGLIASTAILVYFTQINVPSIIKGTISDELIRSTDYRKNEYKYFALHRSLSFSGSFIVVSSVIFYIAAFPIAGLANYLLIAIGAIHYGAAVYVGRKLFYIAQMLHSIEKIDVEEDIFTNDKLGAINTYVNSVTTMTLLFVFAHVYFFYNGPFAYTSFLGTTVRPSLLLLAVLAAPVLALFNFYPRTVIKGLYDRSISNRVEAIKRELSHKKSISEIERLTYLIEYDKVAREELKYRMRVTLSDLPIAITIIIMIVSLFKK